MKYFRIAPFLVLFLFPYFLFSQVVGSQVTRSEKFKLDKDTEFLEKQIYVKIKPEYRAKCAPDKISIPTLEHIFHGLQISKMELVFPFSPPPDRPYDQYGRKMVDVSLIYEVTYDANIDMEAAVNYILNSNAVEYAEPHYVYELMGGCVPTDPNLGDQYYLPLISAYDAWCESQGDTSVVIGIIDTGTSFIHYELDSSHAYNYADPIDGTDNDGDGYIDNYRGWDFLGDFLTSPGDNNPTFGGSVDHGVTVAGPMLAQHDNGSCYAGVGYNCRQTAIKVVINNGSTIVKGYEAIVYGADHDIPFMNCSWGGTVSAKFGEDAINYAAINKGCVVVAASGNFPTASFPFYPASYHNAVSVGGTQIGDAVWVTTSTFGTTYNYLVDVCAPARGVATTTSHSFCTNVDAISGTSLAAPMVCGAMGLAKAKFPTESVAQITQRVRYGADDLYSSWSGTYNERLGKGRLNAHAPLVDTFPSVRILEWSFDDHDNGRAEVGDTLDLDVKFVNYLEPLNDLSITLSTPNTTWFTILNPTLNVGALGTNDTVSSKHVPFRVVVTASASTDGKAYFRFGYSDPGMGYDDWEYVNFRVQETVVHLDANKIESSMDGRGNIGWTDGGSGRGFYYNGDVNYLGDGGFLMGTGPTKVSNCIPNSGPGSDAHFFNLTPASREIPGALADLQAHTYFSDGLAGINSLDCNVEHNAYQYTHEADDDYIIHQYTITNNGADTLRDAYAGMYADWDMSWWDNNHTSYDSTGRLVYCWEDVLTSFNYTAMGPITLDSMHAYSFNENTFPYTIASKWTALSSHLSAANSDTTNIISFVSQGPFDIAPTASHTVAFFMVGGETLTELRANAAAAREKYFCVIEGSIPKVHLGSPQLHCGDTTLLLDAGAGYATYAWSTGDTTSSISVDTSGTYLVEVTDGLGCRDYSEVSIEINSPVSASFTASALAVNTGDTVWFTNATTPDVFGTTWDFGDGTGSMQSDPYHVFTTSGTYNVTLSTSDCICEDSFTLPISVTTLVSTPDPEFSQNMKVYPNPATNQLNISMRNGYSGKVTLELFNLMGQKSTDISGHKSDENWVQTLDVNAVSSGVYFLRISTEEGKRTVKVLLK